MNRRADHEESAGVRPWRRYEPTPYAPWNLRRVVHLHRRAGFAATWNELQRDLRDGPEASLERILKGTSRQDGQPADFERLAGLIGESAARSGQPQRLKAWWLYRMLFAPDPLAERLALCWHNHFATSNQKVNDLALMRRQNGLFRALGRKPFAELLPAVVRDPALLLWLDAPSNHKGRPNENLARELLELFTLGIGHYSEHDVKEAARALTGWTVSDEFAFRSELHDDGEKTILGRRGAWTGGDVLELTLEHPATAWRLAWRLCSEFLGEDVADGSNIEALAAELRGNGLDIGHAVETILCSEVFFSEANIRSRVASPVEFVVAAVRLLEQFDSPPQTFALADWASRLGQDLFYPPNVGGWHGGRDWLRAGALIGRTNFAVDLATGRLITEHTPPDWRAFAARHSRSGEPDGLVPFLADLLFGGEPSAGWNERIVVAATSAEGGHAEKLQHAIAVALGSPEAQLV